MTTNLTGIGHKCNKVEITGDLHKRNQYRWYDGVGNEFKREWKKDLDVLDTTFKEFLKNGSRKI